MIVEYFNCVLLIIGESSYLLSSFKLYLSLLLSFIFPMTVAVWFFIKTLTGLVISTLAVDFNGIFIEDENSFESSE